MRSGYFILSLNMLLKFIFLENLYRATVASYQFIIFQLKELQQPAECDELPHQRGEENEEEVINKAATILQAGFKGYMTRKQLKTTKQIEVTEEESEVDKEIKELDRRLSAFSRSYNEDDPAKSNDLAVAEELEVTPEYSFELKYQKMYSQEDNDATDESLKVKLYSDDSVEVPQEDFDDSTKDLQERLTKISETKIEEILEELKFQDETDHYEYDKDTKELQEKLEKLAKTNILPSQDSLDVQFPKTETPVDFDDTTKDLQERLAKLSEIKVDESLEDIKPKEDEEEDEFDDEATRILQERLTKITETKVVEILEDAPKDEEDDDDFYDEPTKILQEKLERFSKANIFDATEADFNPNPDYPDENFIADSMKDLQERLAKISETKVEESLDQLNNIKEDEEEDDFYDETTKVLQEKLARLSKANVFEQVDESNPKSNSPFEDFFEDTTKDLQEKLSLYTKTYALESLEEQLTKPLSSDEDYNDYDEATKELQERLQKLSETSKAVLIDQDYSSSKYDIQARSGTDSLNPDEKAVEELSTVAYKIGAGIAIDDEKILGAIDSKKEEPEVPKKDDYIHIPLKGPLPEPPIEIIEEIIPKKVVEKMENTSTSPEYIYIPLKSPEKKKDDLEVVSFKSDSDSFLSDGKPPAYEAVVNENCSIPANTNDFIYIPLKDPEGDEPKYEGELVSISSASTEIVSDTPYTQDVVAIIESTSQYDDSKDRIEIPQTLSSSSSSVANSGPNYSSNETIQIEDEITALPKNLEGLEKLGPDKSSGNLASSGNGGNGKKTNVPSEEITQESKNFDTTVKIGPDKNSGLETSLDDCSKENSNPEGGGGKENLKDLGETNSDEGSNNSDSSGTINNEGEGDIVPDESSKSSQENGSEAISREISKDSSVLFTDTNKATEDINDEKGNGEEERRVKLDIKEVAGVTFCSTHSIKSPEDELLPEDVALIKDGELDPDTLEIQASSVLLDDIQSLSNSPELGKNEVNDMEEASANDNSKNGEGTKEDFDKNASTITSPSLIGNINETQNVDIETGEPQEARRMSRKSYSTATTLPSDENLQESFMSDITEEGSDLRSEKDTKLNEEETLTKECASPNLLETREDLENTSSSPLMAISTIEEADEPKTDSKSEDTSSIDKEIINKYTLKSMSRQQSVDPSSHRKLFEEIDTIIETYGPKKDLTSDESKDHATDAAIKIQSLYRGYRTRRHLGGDAERVLKDENENYKKNAEEVKKLRKSESKVFRLAPDEQVVDQDETETVQSPVEFYIGYEDNRVEIGDGQEEIRNDSTKNPSEEGQTLNSEELVEKSGSDNENVKKLEGTSTFDDDVTKSEEQDIINVNIRAKDEKTIDENEAAAKIQKSYRSYRKKRDAMEKEDDTFSATSEEIHELLQDVNILELEEKLLDYPSTESTPESKIEELKDDLDGAATIIQSTYRGFKTRRDIQGKGYKAEHLETIPEQDSPVREKKLQEGALKDELANTVLVAEEKKEDEKDQTRNEGNFKYVHEVQCQSCGGFLELR